jgi:nicotinamide-nucleotide amidase
LFWTSNTPGHFSFAVFSFEAAMSHEVSITDLAAQVVEAARDSNTKIITAESCTAGTLATLLADTPGAGDVFLGGFVTYAKSCKTDVLGIPSRVVQTCSAVSTEVVSAMAAGALEKCPSADIALAVTCVGGPKPDEDGNPVGLTFLAVQRRGEEVQLRQDQIEPESSGRIRGEVIWQALELLLGKLLRPRGQ